MSTSRNEFQTDVELHFAAIPTDRKIDVATVHQLLGVGTHSSDTINIALHHYNQCKREVRSWAAAQIKAIIRENAQKIVTNDHTVEIRRNSCKILDFTDLIKWWRDNCTNDDKRYSNSLYHACYNNFNPGWEVEMEKDFMTTQRWKYTESSIQDVQGSCSRAGFTMKGCVAKNISNVKCELMKQLNMAGKKKGIAVSKVRPKEAAWTADGKYVRKKNESTLSVRTLLEDSTTSLTVETDVTKRTVNDLSCEVEDIHEDGQSVNAGETEVMKRKVNDLSCAVEDIHEDNESVNTPIKRSTKNGVKKNQRTKRVKNKKPKTPSPPYVRSEYEEMCHQKKLRNEALLKEIMDRKSKELQQSLERIQQQYKQPGKEKITPTKLLERQVSL